MVATHRIDLLEEYIKKYSGKAYRHKKTLVDSATVLLANLRKQFEGDSAYNVAHPLFTNANIKSLPVWVNGVDSSIVEIFKDCFDTVSLQTKHIGGIRFPASISVDYIQNPPVIVLNCYFNPQKDIEIVSDSSKGVKSIRINSIPQAMSFLQQLKNKVLYQTITILKERRVASDVINLKIDKLKQAIYVVRLRKSPDECMLFYAQETDYERELKYYNFIDIMNAGNKNVRVRSENIPLIIHQTVKDSVVSDQSSIHAIDHFFGL